MVQLKNCGYVATVLCLFMSSFALGSDGDYLEKSLRDRGIEPTIDGLRDFLQSQVPSEHRDARIAQLLQQLSSDSYRERIAATRLLAQQSFIGEELMAEVAKSTDPELRWRIAKVLKRVKANEAAGALNQVFRYIELKPVTGLAPQLIPIIQQFEPGSYSIQRASRALQNSATPDDAATLKKIALDTHSESYSDGLRAAAARSWLMVPDESIDSFLGELANDDANELRLVAANAMARKQDKRCLAVLHVLMQSDDPRIRSDAYRMLRAVTGEAIKFRAFADEAERAKSVVAWQTWLESNTDSHVMLEPDAQQELLYDRMLVALYEQDKVLELDSDGNTIAEFTAEIDGPWAVQGLANGHRLVGAYTSRSLVEYDTQGEVVWQKTGLEGPPLSVQRLENGNTLSALSDGQTVIEVDPEGNIVWEIDVEGRPCDAKRTEEGTTLIALVITGEVIEVDRSGKTIWKLEGLEQPCGARRLENGNTLVALWRAGEVAEYNPEGNVVWKGGGLRDPRDAQRLPNGNTIASHRGGIVEFDPSGKSVRELEFKGIGSFHYY